MDTPPRFGLRRRKRPRLWLPSTHHSGGEDPVRKPSHGQFGFLSTHHPDSSHVADGLPLSGIGDVKLFPLARGQASLVDLAAAGGGQRGPLLPPPLLVAEGS
eukprot:8136283-Lingulodinium_polyedra.AAC.1